MKPSIFSTEFGFHCIFFFHLFWCVYIFFGGGGVLFCCCWFNLKGKNLKIWKDDLTFPRKWFLFRGIKFSKKKYIYILQEQQQQQQQKKLKHSRELDVETELPFSPHLRPENVSFAVGWVDIRFWGVNELCAKFDAEWNWAQCRQENGPFLHCFRELNCPEVESMSNGATSMANFPQRHLHPLVERYSFSFVLCTRSALLLLVNQWSAVRTSWRFVDNFTDLVLNATAEFG